MSSRKATTEGLFSTRQGAPPIPGESSTLQGTIAKVTFQSPDGRYTVLRLEVENFQDVTVVGEIFPVSEGEEIRVSGTWKIHPRYGLQFQVEQWQKVEPATLAGIERYLGSGLIKGLGPAYARRLVEAFGLDTLRVLSQEPHRLLEVEGIGKGRWQKIMQEWAKQKGMQEVMVFLQGHGVSSSLAMRIYRALGPQTIAQVKDNPYGLAEEVFGIGFVIADRIADGLGIRGDSPLRVRAGILHILSRLAEQGHCYIPLDALKTHTVSLLSIDEAIIDGAIGELVAEGKIIKEAGTEESSRIFPRLLFQAEKNVAASIRRLLAEPSLLTPVKIARLEENQQSVDLLLEEKQQQAILQALHHKVSIITGGPGTGKTTLLSHLLTLFKHGNVSFVLAAPTGRAAKRMGEMAGVEAKTIHRLLEFNPRGGGFQRDEESPLEVDVVIIDEASMVDLPLMDHLLRAIRSQSHLILIGDVDQLPSVGPGNVLRDLIESKVVPVVVLEHIFRQAGESLIVVNAHRILQGEELLLDSDKPTPDFVFVQRETPEEILETLKQLVKERIPRLFHDRPKRGIQVLTPMNRGALGTINLNQELQELLNPEGNSVERGRWVYRIGDKVMQLRNNYEKNIFNGDLGRIESMDLATEKLKVNFEGSLVTYDFDELDEMSLAYATSVHKSQGSEYPAVVIPLHTSHYPMLHRSILYTAVTRGKELVVLVGSKKAVWMAIRNLREERRFTGLKDKLREAV
ncbi:MAG: ATP-dependent RecD-like DNA helicase [Deltaproteobacteria bacterium]|nr:ATP-dependent RecD-like DNA helicase [Deltaproteobacteria bacterium]